MKDDKVEVAVNPGDSLTNTATKLLEYKSKGINATCIFNNHILESNQLNSIDDAYKIVFGISESEYRKQQLEFVKSRLKEPEKTSKDTPISFNSIIEGLKLIAENDSTISDLKPGLIERGCSFTLSDVNKQFEQTKLYNGRFDDQKLTTDLEEGYLGAGAFIIVNMRDYSNLRYAGSVMFLAEDSDKSIYNFIRIATGDETYTKENVTTPKKMM